VNDVVSDVGITILLALSVYQMIVNEKLPATSDAVPLLGNNIVYSKLELLSKCHGAAREWEFGDPDVSTLQLINTFSKQFFRPHPHPRSPKLVALNLCKSHDPRPPWPKFPHPFSCPTKTNLSVPLACMKSH